MDTNWKKELFSNISLKFTFDRDIIFSVEDVCCKKYFFETFVSIHFQSWAQSFFKMSYFKFFFFFYLIIISKSENRDIYQDIFKNFFEKSIEKAETSNKELIPNCRVSQTKIFKWYITFTSNIIDCFQFTHKEKYLKLSNLIPTILCMWKI